MSRILIQHIHHYSQLVFSAHSLGCVNFVAQIYFIHARNCHKCSGFSTLRSPYLFPKGYISWDFYILFCPLVNCYSSVVINDNVICRKPPDWIKNIRWELLSAKVVAASSMRTHHQHLQCEWNRFAYTGHRAQLVVQLRLFREREKLAAHGMYLQMLSHSCWARNGSSKEVREYSPPARVASIQVGGKGSPVLAGPFLPPAIWVVREAKPTTVRPATAPLLFLMWGGSKMK